MSRIKCKNPSTCNTLVDFERRSGLRSCSQVRFKRWRGTFSLHTMSRIECKNQFHLHYSRWFREAKRLEVVLTIALQEMTRRSKISTYPEVTHLLLFNEPHFLYTHVSNRMQKLIPPTVLLLISTERRNSSRSCSQVRIKRWRGGRRSQPILRSLTYYFFNEPHETLCFIDIEKKYKTMTLGGWGRNKKRKKKQL
jgi:hypothetical protein